MRCVVLVLALLGAAAMTARAQDAPPDLKGTWSGKGKSMVFGSHAHHPGTQTAADPPRVRDIEATHVVEGQDGRLAWGRSSSAVSDTKEPFAWAISSDNRSIVGADMEVPDHPHLARPHGEVLCPQWHEPDALDRRYLLRDGSGENAQRP